MIRTLVKSALAFPLWAMALSASIVGGGIWAFSNLDIEGESKLPPDELDVAVERLGTGADDDLPERELEPV